MRILPQLGCTAAIVMFAVRPRHGEKVLTVSSRPDLLFFGRPADVCLGMLCNFDVGNVIAYFGKCPSSDLELKQFGDLGAGQDSSGSRPLDMSSGLRHLVLLN